MMPVIHSIQRKFIMRLFNPLILAFSFGLAGNALADTDATITRALKAVIPDQAPDTIAETPIKGLYEVSYGPRLFYVSADGRYLLQGNLLDIHNMTNLTSERQASLTKAALDKLGEQNMIIYPAQQEKHKITVFTDIDCGYYRKLHSHMKEMNERGITVRYVFFPRSGPNTPSYFKAKNVWCAADQRQALTDSKNNKPIESKSCDDPIDKHLQLVRELGLKGTPAIVLEDGRIIPGYVPPDKLEAMLDGKMALPR